MSTIEIAQQNVQLAFRDLTHQVGDIASLTAARDELYEVLDLEHYEFGIGGLQSSAFPYYEVDKLTLPNLRGDALERVFVRAEHPGAVMASRWTKTKDLNTGLEIEMRRANCGAGCKCATEVRIIQH